MTLVDTFAHDGLPPREQWPDLLIEPLGYPAQLNCAVALLDDTIRAGHRDRPAFITDSETLSYGELGAKVDAICRVLVEDLGLVSGNRVLLRAPNTPMMVACWLAVAKAGCIVVATMPLLRAQGAAGDHRPRLDRRRAVRRPAAGRARGGLRPARAVLRGRGAGRRASRRASRPTTRQPTTWC